MQVFIAGATGVLGKRLVAEFSEHGYSVVGLTRDGRGDEIVESRGGEPRRGDLFDEASIVDAARGADVIIHAATAIPTDSPTPAAWERNDRVRTEGARALVRAADEVGAEQLLQQSIVWVARQPDGSSYDEQSHPHPESWTKSALDAELIAQDGGEEYGFDVSVLRCGYFYAPDSYYTRADGAGIVDGERPIIDGSDGVLLSYLHADDAAGAFRAATDHSLSGLYHVVDDTPVSDTEFVSTLARNLGSTQPDAVSTKQASAAMGEITVDLFTHPMATTNDAFKADTDWEPRFPSYTEGLAQVVDEWQSEGYLVDSPQSNTD